MGIQTVENLLSRFRDLKAERVFFKKLAENDNSKQQIYLGSSFSALSFFPYGEIAAFPELKEPNFKASLNFYWITKEAVERASGAQLILYPAYPEVRLSGFLTGCRLAPSQHLQMVPKDRRRGIDGRVLVFATTADGITYGYLAVEGSPLARELLDVSNDTGEENLFYELTLPIGSDQNKALVLSALREIHETGPHTSRRMYRDGEIKPYLASNGSGYTLEALLGIAPNAKAEPDYLGWEIKAYTRSRITLMTPEPSGGLYGEQGVRAFVEKYGRQTAKGDRYFTGTHKINKAAGHAAMTLKLRGYDITAPTKLAVNGAIYLEDKQGNEAATWAFSSLLTHWNRKHAFAAYVPCERKALNNTYHYKSPILMGEQTDFSMYLKVLASGLIVYDPGSKICGPKSDKPGSVKARSQFRIALKDLPNLYTRFTKEALL